MHLKPLELLPLLALLLFSLFSTSTTAQETIEALESSMMTCLTNEGEMDMKCMADIYKKIVDVAEEEYGIDDERFLDHLTTCTVMMLQSDYGPSSKQYVDQMLELTAKKHGKASDEYFEKLHFSAQMLMTSQDPSVAKSLVIELLPRMAQEKGVLSREYQQYKSFVVQTYKERGDYSFAEAIEKEANLNIDQNQKKDQAAGAEQIRLELAAFFSEYTPGAVLPDDLPNKLKQLQDLASFLAGQERYAEALPFAETAFLVSRKTESDFSVLLQDYHTLTDL